MGTDANMVYILDLRTKAAAKTSDLAKAVNAANELILNLADRSRLSFESDKSLFALPGHTAPITAITISKDQKMLCSGSSGTSRRLWTFEVFVFSNL